MLLVAGGVGPCCGRERSLGAVAVVALLLLLGATVGGCGWEESCCCGC